MLGARPGRRRKGVLFTPRLSGDDEEMGELVAQGLPGAVEPGFDAAFRAADGGGQGRGKKFGELIIKSWDDRQAALI